VKDKKVQAGAKAIFAEARLNFFLSFLSILGQMPLDHSIKWCTLGQPFFTSGYSTATGAAR
jgi:hypothetical protein